MKKILLGKDKKDSQEVYTDLNNLAVAIIIGGYGSGKSVWLDSIYSQIKTEGADLIYLDTSDNSDSPKGIVPKHIYRGYEECLRALLEYAELAEQRANGLEPNSKHKVIQIEGHDLAYSKKEAYFRALIKIAENAKQANMSVLLVLKRFHENEVPNQFIENCTLKAVFAGDTYAVNAGKIGASRVDLGTYEKHIEIGSQEFTIVKTED